MFDPSSAQSRLTRLWNLGAAFGVERGNSRVFLDEIVSDRMQLVSGLQVLRDELQFAAPPVASDRDRCAADFSHESVVTTLAYTNCGDRIQQDETENYHRIVASRFATMSETGALKPEAFHPTGGGTDDGATLAHVTWAHALDVPLRRRIYEGNARSFVLCAFDLKTHVGRDIALDGYGRTRESKWREARAACGAIVGCLANYDERNAVHRRLKSDLGEANFAWLASQPRQTEDGVEITAVIAAAIIAVQGMRATAKALEHEMDERGLSHLTASIIVNRPEMPDTVIYLSRATVFGGETTIQGFGNDATKFRGMMEPRGGEKRLHLTYGGMTESEFPIHRGRYDVRQSELPPDIFV